ncbi:hypothetical protein [Reticulibacter mediterranei]|uniref:hypothetical protein n=1 Tax=Reticulibacter mediterranei TaxID=2778369 RepID=UPI001C693682|nr:hypothetical protein [Reticulibacter mediterranei]
MLLSNVVPKDDIDTIMPGGICSLPGPQHDPDPAISAVPLWAAMGGQRATHTSLGKLPPVTVNIERTRDAIKDMDIRLFALDRCIDRLFPARKH